MLPSLIRLVPPVSSIPEPEDLFASSLGSIFTDDLRNQHGDDPNTLIVYESSVFGEMELSVADPGGENERRKFAHYLWNAGVLMGEMVGGRGTGGVEDGESRDSGVWMREGEEDDKGGWWTGDEEERLWSVRDEIVLELGAGWFEVSGWGRCDTKKTCADVGFCFRRRTCKYCERASRCG